MCIRDSVYIGTVEGYPTIDMIIDILKRDGIKDEMCIRDSN